MSASERVAKKFEPLTYRESKYVVERAKGQSRYQSLIAAGFSGPLAAHPGSFETPEILAAIEQYRLELVENTLQTGLIDAIEIHEYLTDALRAKVSDIRRDDGSFIPTSEWPEIWQRMWEAGDVDIETLTERSSDGATKDKRGGWDQIGTVTKVKVKFASRVKLMELAMKHRGVNAMVNPNDKLGEGLSDLAGSIDRAISEGRQRAAQRNRVIDVKSES